MEPCADRNGLRPRALDYNRSMVNRNAASALSAPVLRRRMPNSLRAAVRTFVRQVAERFRPDKIILFGSHAYGRADADSDVDLLVIMPARDVVGQAIRIRRAVVRPFPLDLLVRTPQQVSWGVRENNWFLREIVEEGKVLYEAPSGSVGPRRRGRRKCGTRRGGHDAASSERGMLPCSTGRRKVSPGVAARGRRRRTENS